ncbi:SRPBCC domain-containing protein [Chitinophaga sp. sic0106]|uniref:SRPBCC domain-containing protein n=1 Tax=Chitinophaga sp. sic0106 TaxID=2854785 RepID=UPI001C48A268|nr:SRPBCC domain-containing protein [Chitinophaga sp. sic0106]MBV7532361.1 SRPBCC domain-containing protein [Chitinophaga sp. sic0106]
MKDFKKHFIVRAEPEEVYAALTNPATIQLWTGEKAVMSTEPGTEFSLWEDSIVGRNLEFEEGRKIVQEWYFGEEEAEEPSIVTIILHPSKKGTDVELKHTNIPDEAFEDITEGWATQYFGALIEFYED